MVAILVVLTILAAVLFDVLVISRRKRTAAAGRLGRPAMSQPQPPQGIFLDGAHSWVRIGADGGLRVGVDEFVAEALGDVEGVEVPPQGAQVQRGDPMLRLRVRGREVVVPSPVTGEVLGRNPQVGEKPWLVGRDPYGVGWLVSMRARDLQEAIRPLRIGAGVAGFLRREVLRFADFLASQTLQSAPARLLADGGVPLRGAVAELDDKGVEEFSREFLAADREA